MTALRAEILSTLEEIPENQPEKVLEFMKKILVGDENEITPEMKAYEELHEILNRNNIHVPKDFDYRDEIAKELLGKYASLG